MACKSSLKCLHHSGIGLASNKSLELKTSTRVGKIRLRKRTNNGYFLYISLNGPVPTAVCVSSMPHSVISWLLRRTLQKSYFGSDKLPLVLAQLELWHILPRLCKVCNLVAAIIQTFFHYTVCDPQVKPTMPPSFKHWTCIKQEPGTWQRSHLQERTFSKGERNPLSKKGVCSMQCEECSISDLWRLWHTLGKCWGLFNQGPSRWTPQ